MTEQLHLKWMTCCSDPKGRSQNNLGENNALIICLLTMLDRSNVLNGLDMLPLLNQETALILSFYFSSSPWHLHTLMRSFFLLCLQLTVLLCCELKKCQFLSLSWCGLCVSVFSFAATRSDVCTNRIESSVTCFTCKSRLHEHQHKALTAQRRRSRISLSPFLSFLRMD